MPQGDKSKYSDKQVREADHIAEGYKKRGKSEGWSKKVAWATVNKVKYPLFAPYALSILVYCQGPAAICSDKSFRL